ncbi:hypothetical protein MA6G0728R_2599 [Mycobacteroides abscessus 6G-0728-R]|uniref:Uncharacterized protein n=1 Tax=Mycobacteroides abscessus 1948 TaxID=1299323 RepID=A0A829QFQ0_9MYCO|nr:hypothetical protein MA6G0125R_1631 [Mycobacteroides abscessus 6G-0125-R]EIU60374.1 hypothetical protein MA6G1108_2598 [Mycobacteroides abscessus 6G-1108]EIU91699.1 hypothetical protein MA6G0212_2658 [Mycobacteroides abscessus 6G-0212]EIU98272.1 hypothetical protein MA6G0728R_2599 [Mycobacteroides abscessus 6G-0728-R]EIV36300.1 hypothetical protein MA3A0122S_2172 [Mycobacteroides abscessus 3A-0122-S]EIV54377.1 hypothetical protein MA3A0930R_2656 [Mycobacteroides abscessus 3A-0930-R]EIV5589
MLRQASDSGSPFTYCAFWSGRCGHSRHVDSAVVEAAGLKYIGNGLPEGF